ncbi:hypothetical protein CLOP_g4630 [Closterium sp. NIES-67]|nr:hypothetical protein CLOP_g4630 [Closterium sp. NIES-67]
MWKLGETAAVVVGGGSGVLSSVASDTSRPSNNVSARTRSTSPTSTSLRRRPQHQRQHSQSSSSSVAASFRAGQTPASDWQGVALSTTKWRCRATVPHQAAGSRNRGSAEDELDIDSLAEETAVLRITNHHVDMDLSADDTASGGDSLRAVAWSDDCGSQGIDADDASKRDGRAGERVLNGNALGREGGGKKEVGEDEVVDGEEQGETSPQPIPRPSTTEDPKKPYEFKILKEELKFSRYLNVYNRVVEHPPQPLPNGQTLPASMTRPATSTDEQPMGGDCLLAEEFGVTEERPANCSGHSGGWIGYGLELGQVQGGQGEQRAELWPQQVVEYDVVAANTKSCHFVCVLPFHSKTKTVTLLKEYAQGANALVYTVPCGGYTDNHTSLEDCARRELSEEAKLCGGQLIKLVGDDHPGLLEVKWCKNRFTPFLVIDPQDDADPLPRDLEEFIEVHRVPVDDLQGMALGGDMLLPSVVTCTMALQYLKDHGWL